VAAGMGGGSSDAATVLAMLNDEYKVLTEKQLAELALSIGADVPFFLNPGPAKAGGVGEKTELLDFSVSEIPLLIISPGFPVSAAWAYKNRIDSERPEPGRLEKIIESLKTSDWKTLGILLYNDLAPALYQKFPLLRMLKEKALETGAYGAEISGSGPVLYAVYENRETLISSEKSIRKKFGSSVSLHSAKTLRKAVS